LARLSFVRDEFAGFEARERVPVAFLGGWALPDFLFAMTILSLRVNDYPRFTDSGRPGHNPQLDAIGEDKRIEEAARGMELSLANRLLAALDLNEHNPVRVHCDQVARELVALDGNRVSAGTVDPPHDLHVRDVVAASDEPFPSAALEVRAARDVTHCVECRGL
jgi:hypothetical protein